MSGSQSISRVVLFFFFFSSRRRHTRFDCDWSSDVCSSDLDTTGTILATALAGPGVGIATGVVTSAVNTLRNPTFWPFVVVQIIVALYAWAAARAGLFRSFRTAVPAGLGLGVIASVTSTPISYLVFGCTTTGGIALPTALGRTLGLP